jgi:(2R)-3-sulfolactate dehydrogenase (NADP+)
VSVHLSPREVEDLARRVLLRAGTSAANAEPVVASIVAAEADGIHSHGLFRLPTYAEHVACGKVDGHAVPLIKQTGPAALHADAACGFAHPAIALGLDALIPLAAEAGCAALAVSNSYNCGVVGHHVAVLAGAGLVGLGFANGPAAIAPWGGTQAMFGTTPFAFACPRAEGISPLIVDQSSSVVAKGEVLVHAKAGKPIPLGWALDAEGRPTNDAEAGLAGSMAPFGGVKGASMAMVIELLAAGLTGAQFGYQASSFGGNEGGPPRTGQMFIALNPARLGGASFRERIEAFLQAILQQPGTRLPGDRRLAARARYPSDGVTISDSLAADLRQRAG